MKTLSCGLNCHLPTLIRLALCIVAKQAVLFVETACDFSASFYCTWSVRAAESAHVANLQKALCFPDAVFVPGSFKQRLPVWLLWKSTSRLHDSWLSNRRGLFSLRCLFLNISGFLALVPNRRERLWGRWLKDTFSTLTWSKHKLLFFEMLLWDGDVQHYMSLFYEQNNLFIRDANAQ